MPHVRHIRGAKQMDAVGPGYGFVVGRVRRAEVLMLGGVLLARSLSSPVRRFMVEFSERRPPSRAC